MSILIFIFGLAIGSFLNAYIWRLHESSDRGRTSAVRPRRTTRGPTSSTSVWRGRSMCPKCKKTLQWFELIPLLSFIIQGGRCRGCKQKIDWQYPLVELATGILFLAAFQATSSPMHWYFIAVLIILFVYDLRYGLIPDKVVLPAIVVALFYNVIPSVIEGSHTLQVMRFLHSPRGSVEMTVWGVLLATLIGAGFFAIQHYLSRGRWVGAGDIRFGALMGAMLGWPQILVGLLVSYIVGGVVAAGLLLMGQKKFGQTVPMGTFLAIGTIVTLLWGRQLLKIYFPL